MGVESVNKLLHLASTRTLTGTARRADQITSTRTRRFQRGLLLYPVAVRAPTGHKLSLVNDVTLKASLLSHPIAPNTVISLPACFHITMKDRLKSMWKEGLIPGGLDGNTRIFTFFTPYVPWGHDPGTSLRAWTLVWEVLCASTSRSRPS